MFSINREYGKKIGLLAEDSSIAKKKLLSRESRYSGLLDVLDFSDGDPSSPDALKTALDGYDAWLCYDCPPKELVEKAEVALSSGIKNLVVTSSFPLEDSESVTMVDTVKEKLKDSPVSFTIIRTEGILDGEEGAVYQMRNLTESIDMTGFDPKITKGDLMRIAGESFLAKAAKNSAIAALGGDEFAMSYLKELREKGKDRREELNHILKTGEFKFWRKYQEKKKAEEEAKDELDFTEEQEKQYAQQKLKKDIEEFQEGWKLAKDTFDEKVERRIKNMCEATWWKLYEEKQVTVNRAVFRQKYGELFRPLAVALQKRFDCSYRMGLFYLAFDVKSREEFEDKTGVVMDWDDEEYDKKFREMTDHEKIMDEIMLFNMEKSDTMWMNVIDTDVVTPEVLEKFDEAGTVEAVEVPIKWLR